MNANISDLETHLGYWLRFVSNHVSNSFRSRLQEHNVTVAEWVTLRNLYSLEPCTLNNLSNAVGVDTGALSRLVERLIKKRLASRKISTEDRRSVKIELTDSGRKLTPQLAKEADQNDQHFFKALSKADKEHLMRIMKLLVKIRDLKEKPTS